MIMKIMATETETAEWGKAFLCAGYQRYINIYIYLSSGRYDYLGCLLSVNDYIVKFGPMGAIIDI